MRGCLNCNQTHVAHFNTKCKSNNFANAIPSFLPEHLICAFMPKWHNDDICVKLDNKCRTRTLSNEVILLRNQHVTPAITTCTLQHAQVGVLNEKCGWWILYHRSQKNVEKVDLLYVLLVHFRKKKHCSKEIICWSWSNNVEYYALLILHFFIATKQHNVCNPMNSRK